MNRSVFIDTSYVLALANTADKYHARARTTFLSLQASFITTEAVLTEIGNAFSKIHRRPLGIATINDLRTDPGIEVVTITADLFDRAVTLYSTRLDKEWGLTDCISFIVMQEHGLT